MVKVKVTTTLELELKEAFLATEQIHRKGFDEALEFGVRAFLLQYKESQYIDYEIQRHKQEAMKELNIAQNLESMKQKLSTMKLKVEIQTPNENGINEFEIYRNKRFSEGYATKEKIDLLRINLEKGAVNWERITELYKFKNKTEAREWFEQKVKA